MAVVLITGANRGIGLALVKAYAGQRDRVIACIRATSDRDALDAAVAASPKWIEVIEMDASDPLEIARTRRRLEAEPIDILINNAGIGGPKQALGKLDFDGWLETLWVNVLGPARVSEAFLEHVAKSDRRIIVSITSGMGSIADSSGGYYAYRSSKAALNMTMHNFALDLRSRGVIVVAINPGWVRTDMGGAGAPLSPEASVEAMRGIFDALTLEDSGKFLNYRGGTYPW
jgi:NAD(P)-dependent dehydrogenase (short-subunit alcohol dehydrogenase family)